MIIALFDTFFLGPFVNILVFVLNVLQGAGIPGSLGFAIISLTILSRLVIWPLTHKQIKSSQKMSELKPKLDELKRKYKDDKKALQEAQLSLYKEHGINPAAGCLPIL